MPESHPFPSRPPRITLFRETTPFFFVTFNTFQRRPLLATPEVHETFVRFCERAATEHGVSVGRYVVMPDHVHLFVLMPDSGIRLERWIQSLKAVIGKVLASAGHAKPHWQEGFFDHVMRSGESYGEKWHYVHRNPVRAGLCKSADEWPFQGEIVPLAFR